MLTQEQIIKKFKHRIPQPQSPPNYVTRSPAGRHACNTFIDVQNKGFQVITETQCKEIFHDVSSRGLKIEYCALPSATKGCKSLLKPDKETGVPLVLYRKGENAMLQVNNEERTGSITDIHSAVIQNGDATEIVHLFVEAQLYQHVTEWKRSI